MKILHRIKSTNIEELITPTLIVIHYTGGSYQRVKELFEKPKTVSAHFVIDLDGAVDNAVSYKPGECYRAWHAGKGEWLGEDGNQIIDINTYSIGIEIVNLNGNIVPYTDEQYASLILLCEHIFDLYPDLRNPNRIIGHEHFAESRGKADPGRYFDWQHLFTKLFPSCQHPTREYVCPEALAESFKKFLKCDIDEKQDKNLHHSFWHAINASMEKTIQLLYEAKNEKQQPVS